MSDFQLSRLDALTSFISGHRSYNRIGDDDTPIEGRQSIAADGAAILYYPAWFVLNVRSGYSRTGWDDFAAKVYNMALATREACRKPALKVTAFYGLKAHVSIGQLAMGETSFHPSQLPDSVLAGFGYRKAKDEQGDVQSWMQAQVRKHDEYMAYVAQRQPGLPAKSQSPWLPVPGTKLMIGGR